MPNYPGASTAWSGSIRFTAPDVITKVVVVANSNIELSSPWTKSGNVYTATIASPATTVTLSVPTNRELADITRIEIHYGTAPDPNAGLLTGKFSVSATKQVQFSQGNLQAYFASAGSSCTWQFATNQWDFIGGKHSSNSEPYTGNNYINGDGTVSHAGTVDLFGWVGEHSSLSAYGINNNNSDNFGNNATESLKSDWGTTMGSGWRTLTEDEWTWLLEPITSASPGTNCRSTTSNIRYAKATVNNVKGVIILPDDWSTSYHSLYSTNTYNDDYSSNNISESASGTPTSRLTVRCSCPLAATVPRHRSTRTELKATTGRVRPTIRTCPTACLSLVVLVIRYRGELAAAATPSAW